MEQLISSEIMSELQELEYIATERDIALVSCYSASHRKYFRLLNKNKNNRKAVIFCLDEKFDEKMIVKYKTVEKVFSQLPVKMPQLIKYDLEKKYLIWEDAGEISLQKLLSNIEKIKEEFIRLSENTVLPFLKGLWDINADFYSELEQFALSKYFFEWEFHTNFQLIQNHFGKIGKSIEPKFWELIISVLFEKFSQMLQTRFVPIHRDLQSSNLFLKNEKLYIIDFQDMYLGHPLYDAVSWIFDSYIELPLDFRFNYLKEIIKKYSAKIDSLRETGQLLQEGLLLVFQRKLHDAGAFVFADERLKSKHFEPYIIPAVKMAAEAALRLKNETLISLTQSLLKFDSKLINGETV